jgi:hypothetical protein
MYELSWAEGGQKGKSVRALKAWAEANLPVGTPYEITKIPGTCC